MHVSRIIINNILGVEHMDITPGIVTQITGQNGTGKSSVLNAIKSTMKGGHDATLLRAGAEKGEVVLILDDGTEIKKTVTSEKSDLKVKGPNGNGGVRLLDGLRDVIGVNPVEFLTAEPKEQLQILLDSIDFELTDEELEEAVGFKARRAGSALETIEALHKSTFEERTGINRDIKAKRATHSQLCETVPTNVVDDPTAEIERLNADLTRIEEQRDHAKRLTDTEKNTALTEAARVRDEEIEKIRKTYDNSYNTITATANTAYDDANVRYDSAASPIKQRIAALQEQLTQKGRFEQQRAIIAQMEAELETLEVDAARKTKALDNLATLKAKKMETMPFPNLKIVDGRMFIGEVPFERLNTAEQVKFALNLAIRRSGELKLICVDGLELLDPARYEKLIDSVKTLADYQLIATRVSDTPLSVLTE